MVATMARAKVSVCKLEDLALIEPFFGDKSVKKELGIQLTDRGYQWFAAVEGDRVVAFAAIAVIKNGTFPFKGAGAEIKYFYVLPEFRKQATGKNLMLNILEVFQCPIKATVTPSSKAFYEGFGFNQVYAYGQHPLMYKP